MERVARRGGWPTLARTTVADVADHLWRRRERLARPSSTRCPGSPSTATRCRRTSRAARVDEVVAVDWGTLGRGPVGADLGYFVLSAREEFEPLLDAYLLGLPDGLATREQAALGARVTAVYTALNRAEWALARVAGGEGALAGEVPPPGGRAVPALPAAAVPADRGAPVGLTARQRRVGRGTCRRP